MRRGSTIVWNALLVKFTQTDIEDSGSSRTGNRSESIQQQGLPISIGVRKTVEG